MWQHVVDTQERRLHEHDASGQRMLSSVQHAEAQRQLHTARRQLERFRVESNEERKERYGELHEAMVDMHTSGLEELDFGRTGI